MLFKWWFCSTFLEEKLFQTYSGFLTSPIEASSKFISIDSFQMADTNGVSSPNSAKDLEIVEVADEYKELEDEEDDDVEEEETYEEEIEDTSDDKGNVEETVSDEKEDDDDIGDQASDSKEEAPENENEKSDSEKGIDDKDESRTDKTKEVDNKKDLKSDTSSTDNRDIRSRVFIGHLNTEKCTRRDLEKLFKPCGKVVAISVLNGYGFIQFDNEESARKAIDDIHGTPFFDMKLGT